VLDVLENLPPSPSSRAIGGEQVLISTSRYYASICAGEARDSHESGEIKRRQCRTYAGVGERTPRKLGAAFSSGVDGWEPPTASTMCVRRSTGAVRRRATRRWRELTAASASIWFQSSFLNGISGTSGMAVADPGDQGSLRWPLWSWTQRCAWERGPCMRRARVHRSHCL